LLTDPLKDFVNEILNKFIFAELAADILAEIFMNLRGENTRRHSTDIAIKSIVNSFYNS